MTNSNSVLVVGCGDVAGKYNEDSTSSMSLTHAEAINKNPKLHFYGCVDTNPERKKVFAKKWNVPRSFNDLNEINENADIDIIVIASPSKLHFDHLQQSIKLSPKVIFLEKPASFSLDNLNHLKKIKNKENIAVNYLRAWDKQVINLKDNLKSQESKLHSVYAICSGEVLNFGSHMIHLLSYLLGKLEIKDISSQGKDINVVLSDSLSRSICINFNDKFQTYSMFQLEFYFEDKIVSMKNNGLVWETRDIVNNEHFPNLKLANQIPSNLESGLLKSFDNAYTNIINFINDNTKLKCTLVDAISVESMCFKIINQKVCK